MENVSQSLLFPKYFSRIARVALTQWLTLACHEVVPGSIAMRSNKMVFIYLLKVIRQLEGMDVFLRFQNEDKIKLQ